MNQDQAPRVGNVVARFDKYLPDVIEGMWLVLRRSERSFPSSDVQFTCLRLAGDTNPVGYMDTFWFHESEWWFYKILA